MILLRVLVIASVVSLAVGGISWTCQATSAARSFDPLHSFVVDVGDRVFFGPNSTSLSSFATSTLTKQANAAKAYNFSLLLEGHTDERGSRADNFVLALKRALVVRDYLIAEGIPPDRLRVASYGADSPMTGPMPDDERQLRNRCVQTIPLYNFDK